MRSSAHGKVLLAHRPAGDPALDEREDDVKRDTQPREQEQPGEDQRHVEVRGSNHHQVADAAVRGDRFAQHRPDEGERDRNLQRGEKIGLHIFHCCFLSMTLTT